MNYIDAEFHLDDSFKKKLQKQVPNFGYNGFGEITYYRSYSRMILDPVTDEVVAQEHWSHTVIRVIEGVMSIRMDHYLKNRIHWDITYWQQFAQEMADSLFRMEWMPPGRGLWSMGTDLIRKRGGMALYNCCYTEIGENWIFDLCWMMDTLMYGCGVGFGPKRTGLSLYEPDGDYSWGIPDSREGWVESLKRLLEAFATGSALPIFDYSEIRPEGSLISTFGGIASGPGPLKDMHDTIRDLCTNYAIREHYDEVLLKTDLANLIGVCVVTGNVRRSAELGLCDFNDRSFFDIKNYKKHPYRAAHGWMSNNSVRLINDSDFEDIDRIAQANISGYDIGYLNMRNVPKGRICKHDDIKKDKATGLNPCQIDTIWLLTHQGLRQLKDVNIGDYIWSECGWTKIVNKVCTGTKSVFRYNTNVGFVECTENHELISDGMKIEAQHCDVIDSLRGVQLDTVEHNPQLVMDGLLLGDGSTCYEHIVLIIGEDDQDYFNSEISPLILSFYSNDKTHKVLTNLNYDEVKIHLPERTIPERYLRQTPIKIASLLRGIYSANGSICGNRITLKTTSYPFMRQVQLLLSSIGIVSYFTTNPPSKIKWKNGEYTSRESYDLNISVDRKRFYRTVGFLQKYKMKKLKTIIDRIDLNYQRNKMGDNERVSYPVTSVDELGEHEVFDITVSNVQHTYWTQGLNVSNCGEILLEDKEVCNVAETLPTRCVDHIRWFKACSFATFYCSTVSLLPTHQSVTNKVVNRNRRIGVSIIDFTGWLHQQGVSKVTSYLREGYKKVRDCNKRLAEEAGVPESIRVTTVKPGGTTPKLAGRTAGAGFPTFKYTIRRIRVQANTVLERLLKEAGIPSEPDAYSKNTTTFEYPIIQGPAEPATEVTIWQQAMNVVLLQREWADNSVSNTLYFKPRWSQISKGKAVIDNDAVPKLKFYDKNNTAHVFPLHLMKGHEPELKIQEELYKIKLAGPITDSKLFRYDPHHEENQIEAVLAAIAPLTKSVSLLPHSDVGIMAQMPEEGITKDEYERRLEAIKPINWSTFIGSDGQDEKYCDGDKCRIPQ